MRLLIVTEDMPPTVTGGVASWVDDLAVALAARGHELTVAARAGRGSERQAEREWDWRRPYRTRRMWGRSWARWGDLWTWWQAGNLLSQADAVVFSTWPLAVRLAPEARRRGVPVAIAFHGSDLTRLEAPPPGLAAVLQAATALVPVSAFLAGELARLGAPDSTVLPMPMALPPPPLPRERRGLLTVARLTGLKGVDRAITLSRRLDQPLRVVGDGPALAELRAAAHEGVQFLGRLERADVARCYQEAAATLLLSRPDDDGSGAEGLGLTLLEAQARGCPVVGAPTGGIPEAVGPGVLLSDPDAPTDDDLDAVRALLADTDAGTRARAFVESRHGPERAAGTLLAALGLAGSA